MEIDKQEAQKFINWVRLKIRIHFLKDRLIYFRDREIWWINLGHNIGNEQNGKNDNFERPILILKKFNKDMFWGIPMTSQEKQGDYYYKIDYKGENGTEQWLILPQLKLMSSKRFLRRIRKITIEEMEKIKEALRRFL